LYLQQDYELILRITRRERGNEMAKTVAKKKEITISSKKQVENLFQKEVNRIFGIQKENRWKIANTTANQRIEKLKKFKSQVEKYSQDLRDAMFKDFRKSPQEVDLTEIMPVISEIKDAILHLKSWMRPVRVGTPLTLFPSSSQIIYEPKGLILIISPWNYPFHLIGTPLVAAIAAGNCTIIKPSNNTKHTAAVTKKMLAEIFDENEVYVSESDRDTATALLEKPFDHIFFTGSTSVGITIMEAAAKNLTSVTLELGGKSPVIIDESVDMDDTTAKVVWGKVLNGGQTCVGVDYVLVHESKYVEFIESCKAQVKKFYGQSAEDWHTTPDFCRIINDKNFERLQETVKSSIKQGAKLELGGEFKKEERYISPTILSNVTLESPVMMEEIFGPILPVMSYKTLDEAIAIVQGKNKPLSLYIFSDNNETIEKILKNTSSGGVVINGVVAHLGNPELPFGGVNHSGIGNYHGHFGFKAFSHERAVLKVSKLTLLRMLFPPYTKTTKAFVDFMTNYL
jgi:aldehyde dehydrogenase (NAD+)